MFFYRGVGFVGLVLYLFYEGSCEVRVFGRFFCLKVFFFYVWIRNFFFRVSGVLGIELSVMVIYDLN